MQSATTRFLADPFFFRYLITSKTQKKSIDELHGCFSQNQIGAKTNRFRTPRFTDSQWLLETQNWIFWVYQLLKIIRSICKSWYLGWQNWDDKCVGRKRVKTDKTVIMAETAPEWGVCQKQWSSGRPWLRAETRSWRGGPLKTKHVPTCQKYLHRIQVTEHRTLARKHALLVLK